MSLSVGFLVCYRGSSSRTLYEDEYVCLLRHGHPLASDGLSLETFRACRHVLVSARAAGHIHQEVEERLLNILPPENIRLVSTNFTLAPMLIVDRDYLLTLPRRVAVLFQEQLGLTI